MIKTLIGHTLTFVCAALIGVGVWTSAAPARALAHCLKVCHPAQ
jgi:hypothetical protein